MLRAGDDMDEAATPQGESLEDAVRLGLSRSTLPTSFTRGQMGGLFGGNNISSLVEAASPSSSRSGSSLFADEFPKYSSMDLGRSTYSDPFSPTSPWDRLIRTQIPSYLEIQSEAEARDLLIQIEHVTLDFTAEILRLSGQVPHDQRILVMPEHDDIPASLILLGDISFDATDSFSNRFAMDPKLIQGAASEFFHQPESMSAYKRIFELVGEEPHLAADLLAITQPEIIQTRQPRMERTCVPDPYMELTAGNERSTAGLLCRDKDGRLGLTACLHGTGPEGTEVQIDGLRSYKVAQANSVQDLVFIPIDDDTNIPPLLAPEGVLQSRAPYQGEDVSFVGATNTNQVDTKVQTHDSGVCSRKAHKQLRLQTPLVTDRGDSGAALIGHSGHVLGFAFDRTHPDDVPKFSDWIWADNALSALGLTPYREE